MFNNITSDQVHAFMRHVYTAVGVGTSVLVSVGLSQGDATKIGTAVQQFGDGIADIIAAVGALAPIISGFYAMWSASRKARLVALNADPQIAKIETVPGTAAHAEANDIPGQKVT